MWSDTVTIYHKTAERQYSRTELSDCEWQGQTKVLPSERGLIVNNSAELFIYGSDAVIAVGDFIVKGSCTAEISGAADLRRWGVEMMTVQAVIRYYDHMEVTGV